MNDSKLIREGRFGPPKAFKTGAVVGTYPKPMLVLNFDAGGLDVLQVPVVYIEPTQLKEYGLKPKAQLPPILAVNFWDKGIVPLNAMFGTYGSPVAYNTFVDCVNIIGASCPWTTVVVDPLTALVEKALGQLAISNSKSLEDARKWAPFIGTKVFQAAQSICTLPCHTVCIMHSDIEKDELTGLVGTYPIIPSKLRAVIGKLFSQYFYATMEGGKPMVYTTDRGYVKGIGARWPHGLPPVCGPTFREIYGTTIGNE